MVVLLGVDVNDNEEDVSWLAKKIANLRIFGDEKKLMNNSLVNVNGDLMIIMNRDHFYSTRFYLLGVDWQTLCFQYL